jgi:hypothetical protein
VVPKKLVFLAENNLKPEKANLANKKPCTPAAGGSWEVLQLLVQDKI